MNLECKINIKNKKINLICIFFSLIILLNISACNLKEREDNMNRSTENITIETDISPIFNHFPELPKTNRINWMSTTSDGIGLQRINLYYIAFYNKDELSSQMSEYKLLEEDSINMHFIPDELKDTTFHWQKIDENFSFQESIIDSKKLHTSAYVDLENGLIYVSAVGEG